MFHRPIPFAAAVVAASIAVALAAGGHAASAQQADTVATCPTGYALIPGIPHFCMSDSGDVVEPLALQQGLSCPKGYEWLADLCFSPATGDITLASDDGALPEAPRSDLAKKPKL